MPALLCFVQNESCLYSNLTNKDGDVILRKLTNINYCYLSIINEH